MDTISAFTLVVAKPPVAIIPIASLALGFVEMVIKGSCNSYFILGLE